MTEDNRNQLYGKMVVAAWKRADALFLEERRRVLPTCDTVKGLMELLPAFERAVTMLSPGPTSGLIEQQRLFSLMRKK